MSHVYGIDVAYRIIERVTLAATFVHDAETNTHAPGLVLGTMDDHWKNWVLECSQGMSLAAQICDNGQNIADIDIDTWRHVFRELLKLSEKFEQSCNQINQCKVNDSSAKKIFGQKLYNSLNIDGRLMSPLFSTFENKAKKNNDFSKN